MAPGAVTLRSFTPGNTYIERVKLTAGAVIVTDHRVTDSTLIFVAGQDSAVTGIITITRTSGTSFTITSSAGGDTGFVAVLYILVNDAVD